MKPKHSIGQLAQVGNTFAVITGLMNRGGVYAYELKGEENLVAEEAIDKVWIEKPAPRTRTKSEEVTIVPVAAGRMERISASEDSCAVSDDESSSYEVCEEIKEEDSNY